MGDSGKKPLHLLVIDLMKAKAFMAGVSKCAETELFELGALLQASEWRSYEDITVAARLIRNVRLALLSAGDTMAAHLFLQKLSETLYAEAAKMDVKPPHDFLKGMHPD